MVLIELLCLDMINSKLNYVVVFLKDQCDLTEEELFVIVASSQKFEIFCAVNLLVIVPRPHFCQVSRQKYILIRLRILSEIEEFHYGWYFVTDTRMQLLHND